MNHQRTIWIGCLLLALATVVVAQNFQARLVGTITDATDAALPGATVTATNVGTNQSFSAVTNEQGAFVIANLTPAVYHITVTANGFKKAARENVRLEVEQVQRLDFKLETGAVTETVTVIAEAPLINTETGSKGVVVSNAEIVDLPLNGRDFSELAFLTPGVVEIPEGLPNGGFAAVNGGRGDNVNFQIDGFNNRSNRAGSAVVSPSVDAIAEFKVQTSAYSAEFGQVGSGAINLALKSGTNKYSGTLYEFFRDDLFDARSFFAPRKEDLRRNQFGGTFGGPLALPRFGEGGPVWRSGKDRTFFFISYEGLRETRGRVEQSVTITQKEKAGDFSESFDRNGCNASAAIRAQLGQTCTPLNLVNPFAANANLANRIIPGTIKNALGQRLINLYPDPNQSGVTNYVAIGTETSRDDAYILKLDHRATQKMQLAFNYLRNNNNGRFPFSQGSAYPGFGGFSANRNQQFGGRMNYNFSPSLIFETRVARNLTDNQTQANTRIDGTDEKTQLAKLLGGTLEPNYFGFPRVVIRGLANFGDNSSEPINIGVKSWQVFNALTWVKGQHFVRIGADYIYTDNGQDAANDQRGSLRFANGLATNFPIADALIGIPNQTSRFLSTRFNRTLNSTTGIFVQDDYAVSARLKLNLGVRYDYFQAPREASDLFSAFLPDIGKVVVASVAAGFNPNDARTVPAKDVGLSNRLVKADKNNFSPRLGFALRLDKEGNTVARGGYGLFYANGILTPIRQNLGNNFPISFSQAFNRVTSNLASLTLNAPYPNATTLVENAINGLDSNAPTATVQQFNLTFERQLFGGMAAEISYVGSRGKHLSQRYNVNQEQYVRDASGNIVTTLVGTTRTAQTVRRFALFPTANVNYIAFGASSQYDALQATLRRDFRKGMGFRVNYVFSKSIDDASALTANGTQGNGNGSEALDPNNLRLERGLSGFHRTHALTMNYNYQLPFGRGKRFFNQRGMVNTVIGGWQFTGLGRFLSGQPFSVGESAQTFNQGESIRPDRVCDGRLDNATIDRWFDTSCFRSVPTFNLDPNRQDRRGTSGRNILVGPPRRQFDVSLQKFFNVAENKRLQFRWEVFNVTNTANFRLPVRQIDAVNAGRITASDDGRKMQFALKYLF